jgi:hypothetical protein
MYSVLARSSLASASIHFQVLVYQSRFYAGNLSAPETLIGTHAHPLRIKFPVLADAIQFMV